MKKQDLLEHISAGKVPTGALVRKQWRWELDGQSVTRAVNSLVESGTIQVIERSPETATVVVAGQDTAQTGPVSSSTTASDSATTAHRASRRPSRSVAFDEWRRKLGSQDRLPRGRCSASA